MSIGTAGSLIMDAVSLFFMAGILNYTHLYRKRGRLDDRLYFAMILVNVVVALGALLIASRIGWGFMFRDISSTALTYTLFLVCIHLHVMNAPLVEDKIKEEAI